MNHISKLKKVIGIKSLALLAVVLTLFDKVVYNSSLYADGACDFMHVLYLNHFAYTATNRPVGDMLHAIPVRVLQMIGVEDDQYIYYAWKIGFAFTFAVAYLLIGFYKKRYQLIGYYFLSMSILIFYIANSIFSVAEYIPMYSLLALLLPAIFWYKREGDATALYVIGIISILLCLNYEAGISCSIAVLLSLIAQNVLKIKKEKYYHAKVTTGKHLLALISLLVMVILTAKAVLSSMPVWAAQNAKRSLTTWIIEYRWGAMFDTWLYFIVGFFIYYMLIFSIGRPKRTHYVSLRDYLFAFVLGLFCIAASHYPNHSLYSKGVYVILIVAMVVAGSVFSVQNFHLAMRRTFYIVLAVLPIQLIYVVKEGARFDQYLAEFKSIIELHDEDSVNSVGDLEFFAHHGGAGEAAASKLSNFSWSWGQLCLSVYLKPANNAKMVSPLDKEYMDPAFYSSLIDNKKSKIWVPKD